MRKAVLVGMVGCLFIFGTLASAADVKLGYINLQRVKETDEWKRLEALFEAEVNKSKIEVAQKKKEFDAAALQYQRQRSMLSEDAQMEKEQELKKQQLEFQLWAQERQKTLERKRSEMSQQIWSKINEVIQKIARKKKLTLVIDYDPDPSDVTANFEKGIVYLAPEIDITDEVIKAFNALAVGES